MTNFRHTYKASDARKFQDAVIKVSFLLNDAIDENETSETREKCAFKVLNYDYKMPDFLAYALIRAAKELFPIVSQEMRAGANPKQAWSTAFLSIQ